MRHVGERDAASGAGADGDCHGLGKLLNGMQISSHRIALSCMGWVADKPLSWAFTLKSGPKSAMQHLFGYFWIALSDLRGLCIPSSSWASPDAESPGWVGPWPWPPACRWWRATTTSGRPIATRWPAALR